MRTTIAAFPLCWPDSWPRSATARRAPFRFRAMAHEARALLEELRRLGADPDDVVISSNVVLRLDGLPRSNQRCPEDPGVAVYFQIDGEDLVLACDRWDRVEHNLRAVTKHVEAIRGQERWGVGSVSQAFRGYRALPERASASSCWEVLGCSPEASPDVIEARFRELAKSRHPDRGGDPQGFQDLVEARDQARALVSS